VYFELENRTWRQFFRKSVRKKKQLYRPEVPDWRSGVQKAVERRSGAFRFNLSTD